MRWAGFIRNVMIGREGLHRDVLLRLLDEAGGRDGASHLATGNVTFIATTRDVRGVVRRLEDGIATVIGRPEPVITRRLDWVQQFVASEPFAAYDDKVWELLVALLPLDAAPLAPALLEGAGETVIVDVADHELVGARPRDRHAPHVNVLAEKASGVRCTSRGWSTLVRLSRA
jgi:uncharacterized protein (DUF1697 family)